MVPNRLAGEASPYLLQHAGNPVDWRPWGAEAFADARRSGRPVLLSVGYAACHWCHVMAHESFENPEIARLMNTLFVSIKVDREERPDVDMIYQAALAALGQQGGWPLTMFLTPDAEPFWGGTYFPPERRWGRPGFPEVLRAVAATFHDAPDKVAGNGAALRRALGTLSAASPGAGDALDPALLDDLADRLLPHLDPVWGGLAGAPKFPQPGLMRLFWRAFLRSGRTDARDAVLRMLRGILQGGIWDHLGGGLARYSTDEAWLVPHFEKMLYDNAQLLSLLALVARGAPDPLFAIRAAEIVQWLDREMTLEGGAFAASLDADSEGEEGRFYVWTEAEIDAVLESEAAFLKHAYDVTPAGNWEGRVILNRRHAPELLAEPDEARLAALRHRLLAHRAQRVPPGRDDKILADWNGLMIAALAEAGAAFDRSEWIDRARRAFGFVTATMAPEPGRLLHGWRAGRAGPAGLLDDYAAMAKAALALFEATGEGGFLTDARGWVATLDRAFADPAGGYRMNASDGEALLVPIRTAVDNATPSGNGMALGVLARLWHLTGEAAYQERARGIVRAFGAALQQNAFGLSTWIDAALTLDLATQVVVVGPDDDPAAAELLRTARGAPSPDLMVVPALGRDALPAGHPAAGKGPVAGRAAAYVCRDFACLPPVTDASALRVALGA